MNRCELFKLIAPILLFSVVLPAIDIGTDLRFIIRLYTGVCDGATFRVVWSDYYDKCQDFHEIKHQRYCNASKNPVCPQACDKYEDFQTCLHDPVFFCDYLKPQSPMCKFIKHPTFATMLLGLDYK